MSSRTCLARWLVPIVVLLGPFLPSAIAQSERASAPIDPAVVAQLNDSGEATFWVVFREQADLSPAVEIRDWGGRGRFVYERLVEVAHASQAGVRAVLSDWGAEARPYWIVNAIMVRTHTSELVSLLAARAEVSGIITTPEVSLAELVPGDKLPREGTIEWNIDHIRAPLVWSTFGTRGEGIVIAFIDTGAQYDHPALVDHYRGNLGGGLFDHNYNWYDPAFVCGYPSTAPCDSGYHGTAIAGFAVGDDGGMNQIGVAPGARFISVAMNGTAQAVLDGGQWLLAPTDLNGNNPRPDLRPHIVNSSYQLTGGGDPIFRPMVQAWRAAGMFPTAMIGNSGPDCGSLISPADYPESYAVGGFDVNDTIWFYSSRGPSSTGTIKPDITAPGVDMRTCCPIDSYMMGTGTSGSNPHVSGTVALMWSLNPELIGDIESTQEHLDVTAIDSSDITCGGAPGNNNVWGEGRLDAFGAVSLVFTDGLESGDTSEWSATVP